MTTPCAAISPWRRWRPRAVHWLVGNWSWRPLCISGSGRDGVHWRQLSQVVKGGGWTFRIRPVATFPIARITQRDSDQWSKGVTQHRNFAPGGRLVTAGDGNMVRVGHIGHQRRASNGGRSTQGRTAVPVQEERPYTCLHEHQKRNRF